MAQKLTGGKLTFQNPILGGIADTKYLGRANSFHKIVGLDIFSDPGMIMPSQAMKNETTINEKCNDIVYTTNSTMFFFSRSTGKIWKRVITTGVTTLIHTTVPTSGSPACLGAAEYNGYIYWATAGYLHRIPLSNTNAEPWSTGLEQNWKTLPGNNINKMLEVNSVLYICTTNTISQVDNVTFTASKLTLPYNYYANALAKSGTDLVIGANYANDSKRALVLVWNTYSKSFSYSDELQDNYITTMIEYDNTVLIFVGKSGNVYYLNGTKADIYMRLPYGNVVNNRIINAQYYPNVSVDFNSVYVYRNYLYIGVTDYNKNMSGLYVFGSYSPEYAKVLTLQYPLSWKTAGAFTLSAQIYAVNVTDNNNEVRIYVTWSKTVDAVTTYSLDVLDIANRNTLSYIDTKLIFPDNYNLSRFTSAWADYEDLPAGAALDMQICANHAANYGSSVAKVTDTMRNTVNFELGSVEAKVAQLRLLFTSTANAYPKVHQFGVKID